MKLPTEFIIYDLEYTAWEGSWQRNWSGPNERREIIEIGAIRVSNFEEADSFRTYVRPRINPKLSQYIVDLTGITQARIDEEGVSFPEALRGFGEWAHELTLASYGRDAAVLRENCELNGVPFPFHDRLCLNLKDYIDSMGIDSSQFMSSTISEAFGINSPFRKHDGLSDARSLLIALKAARVRS